MNDRCTLTHGYTLHCSQKSERGERNKTNFRRKPGIFYTHFLHKCSDCITSSEDWPISTQTTVELKEDIQRSIQKYQYDNEIAAHQQHTEMLSECHDANVSLTTPDNNIRTEYMQKGIS